MTFRCSLKPYVYIFVFVNIEAKQACILSFSFGFPKLLIAKKCFTQCTFKVPADQYEGAGMLSLQSRLTQWMMSLALAAAADGGM